MKYLWFLELHNQISKRAIQAVLVLNFDVKNHITIPYTKTPV